MVSVGSGSFTANLESLSFSFILSKTVEDDDDLVGDVNLNLVDVGLMILLLLNPDTRTPTEEEEEGEEKEVGARVGNFKASG
ncbi:uncharacterized protein KQ657_003002 [Scheffersomyces spartinae]|uniref:Uncharacterized protein n=1 Tax=Scheffersomyces spartinae TaxID=45513 RepID=A0A9P8AGZ6_9ASCO|nr:uncharacterized protein KQ657_003002 [Scheffersomyces spartinae]KAG7191607.1 hypothetical protein KQ657_003002 [Scheffersomyces spartinae]